MMIKKQLLIFSLFIGFSLSAQKNYYELRTYELKFGSSQQAFHDYVSKALIPTLNKNGVEKVGVFSEYGDPTPTVIRILIPYRNTAHHAEVMELMGKDEAFAALREDYDKIPVEKAVYNRYSTSFFTAFDGLPTLVAPQEDATIYELRTYEGYSEDAVRRKVKMFNTYEFEIFDNTGLHSVFFGEQVAGPNMPALTYMLSFTSMEARDANWDKFRVHPLWQKISKMEEFANSVSNIQRNFLEALPYSQL